MYNVGLISAVNISILFRIFACFFDGLFNLTTTYYAIQTSASTILHSQP